MFSNPNQKLKENDAFPNQKVVKSYANPNQLAEIYHICKINNRLLQEQCFVCFTAKRNLLQCVCRYMEKRFCLQIRSLEHFFMENTAKKCKEMR